MSRYFVLIFLLAYQAHIIHAEDQSSILTYTYTNFSSITFSWTSTSKSTGEIYQLVVQQTLNENLIIYNGTQRSYTINMLGSFERYYYVSTILLNSDSVSSNRIYIPKVLIVPADGIDISKYHPLIATSQGVLQLLYYTITTIPPINTGFLSGDSSDTPSAPPTTVLSVSELDDVHGTIRPIVQWELLFDFEGVYLCLDEVLILGGPSGLHLSSGGTFTRSVITGLELSSTNPIMFWGSGIESTGSVFVAYYSLIEQLDYTNFDGLFPCFGANSKTFVREHNSQLYVGLFCTSDPNYSFTLLEISFNSSLSASKTSILVQIDSLKSSNAVMDVDHLKNNIYLVMEAPENSIISYNIEDGKLSYLSTPKPSISNKNLIVRSPTYGAGFWQAVLNRNADLGAFCVDLYYHDLVSPQLLMHTIQLASISSLNQIDVTSITMNENKEIAVAGIVDGTQDPFSQSSYFVLYVTDTPMATTFTIANSSSDSVTLLWTLPTGISTAELRFVSFTVYIDSSEQIYVGRDYTVTISNLLQSTTYYFNLNASLDGVTVQYPAVKVTTSAHECTGVFCGCPENSFSCENGSCVDDITQCIIVPPVLCPLGYFLCSNNSCVKSHLECIAGSNCSGLTCWDGSCVGSALDCASVPSCPFLSTRCPDGTCASTTQKCAITGCDSASLCLDGSCPPCRDSYGCPAVLPILCPSGSCVSNVTQCSTNCTRNTFACFDGTCQTNISACPTVPRLQYPVTFSYSLGGQNNLINPTEKLAINILSAESLIAQIFLPNQVVQQYLGSVLSIRPVPDSDLYNVSGVSVWGNQSTYSDCIMSAVLSIQISNFSNIRFAAPVLIAFNNLLPPNINQSNLCMAFINRTSNKWQCESTIQVLNGIMYGNTSHFTEFAVLIGSISAPEVTVIEVDDFKLLNKVNKSTAGIYVLAFLVFFYLCGLIFTVRIDRRNALCVEDKLNFATKQSIQLDTMGNGVSVDTPTSPQLKSPSSLITPNEEGELKDNQGQSVGFRRLVVSRLRIKHSWIAVLFSPAGYKLTRTNTLTLLLCMVFSNLMIGASFYNYTSVTGIAQRVLVGIVVACIVFPITLIFSFIFRYVPKQYSYISYILIYGYCSICFIITLVLTLKFEEERARAWLTSMAISTAHDGLVSQPFKLLISSLCIILFSTSPFIWIML